MLFKALLAVYSLLLIDCSGYKCEVYFDTKLPFSKHCNKSHVDEMGYCNYTKDCSKGDLYCYTYWRTISSTVTEVQKGCTNDKGLCSNRTSCIAVKKTHHTRTHPHKCCCEGDFCSDNYQPYDNSKDGGGGDNGDNPEVVEEDRSDITFVLLTTLVPIIVLCVTIVLGYFCYHKRKQAFSQMNHRQAETAVSRLATTNLLSSNQSEVHLPQLIEVKARGRFGCVWKAQLHNRYVAVKIFSMQDKQSWQNEQDVFNTELVGQHPNILHCIATSVREVGVVSELWLVTEFHENGSLADYLKVRTLSLSEALSIIQTMANGLAFLHEDVACRYAQTGYKPAIAHRDFKSRNVLITNQKTAIIADFGLAVKFVPGENMGDTHSQVGTRRYMAPEILEGAINFQRDAFLRIDIYAFALVMWEVVTRCYESPGGAETVYLMPYELEIGQHPSLEEMQDCVIEKKIRPNLRREWRRHRAFKVLCDTIEECWDHDAEARLSAGCVEERIRNLQMMTISSPDLPIQSNRLDSEVIINTTPLNPPPPINTAMQNHINNQKNEILYNNTATDEASLPPRTDGDSLHKFQIPGPSGSMLLPPNDEEPNA